MTRSEELELLEASKAEAESEVESAREALITAQRRVAILTKQIASKSIAREAAANFLSMTPAAQSRGHQAILEYRAKRDAGYWNR